MRAGERGSIVIEAMIAALIVAGLAGTLFEAVAARGAAARRLAVQREALLVAQSHLAAADLHASEVPGVREGVDGALAWRLRAAPFEPDVTSAAGTLALLTMTVADRAMPARTVVVLRTLRLVR